MRRLARRLPYAPPEEYSTLRVEFTNAGGVSKHFICNYFFLKNVVFIHDQLRKICIKIPKNSTQISLL
jgi:hypothetical protein